MTNRLAVGRSSEALQWMGLICLALCIALYSYYLSKLFYFRFGGFFDSMSYFSTLALVVESHKTHSVLEILDTVIGSSTVLLPWIEAYLISFFTVHSSRALALVIQLPWLILLGIISFRYFRRFPRMPVSRALSSSAMMISFSALFQFNGGLSDFRMDLLQALTFGCAVFYWLSIRRDDRLMPWAISGLLIGIAGLARATTPVYVVMFFLPMVAMDFINLKEDRLKIISKYGIMTVVAVAVCGVFYAANLEYLKYYYLVWNTDANAHLPWDQSLKHVQFAFGGIGRPIIIFAAFSILLYLRLRPFRVSFDGRALWAGLGPLAYLVGSGAGLNPFVSMVAIPGLLGSLLTVTVGGDGPSEAGPRRSSSWPLRGALTGLGAIVAIVATAIPGVANHSTRVSPWVPLRAGISDIVDEMTADMNQHGELSATFAVAYIGGLATLTITDHLIYERGYRLASAGCATKDGTTLAAVASNFAAEADWSAMRGTTYDDKAAALAQALLAKAKYIVLADPASALPPLRINQELPVVRSELMAGGASPLGGKIEISTHELAVVYRNPAVLSAADCAEAQP